MQKVATMPPPSVIAAEGNESVTRPTVSEATKVAKINAAVMTVRPHPLDMLETICAPSLAGPAISLSGIPIDGFVSKSTPVFLADEADCAIIYLFVLN